ncbi:metallo-beta-lactamase superfamily protein [Coniochaeta ligniaria NRRL 30616]|uniref:Metallo-beta-lactamase superfamily protein n=1 Tax=Coniochaeta ligniaria NRRL 30616 TaxID=1408157 RepID=A0A1J7JZT0_9PEZI|nr:metallo-beta-lactamase superfamily protein [Coniochaeta ligniaria NRRL 30616]
MPEDTSFDLPSGSTTVRLQLIDTGSRLLCKANTLLEPEIAGHEFLNLPNVCWLVENLRTGRKVLFDCGVRKSFKDLPPMALRVLEVSTPGIHVDWDVADVLSKAHVNATEIDWMIWSHHHWDHTGDPSRFPANVGIVVGPGFTTAHLPAYPANPNSEMLEKDFVGRPFWELRFDDNRTIGGLRAYDFWGDGSLYILDTPGHSVGHISALARTCAMDFVFMGGDICHFPGVFRPSNYIPLPNPLDKTARLDKYFTCPCAATTFPSIHPKGEEAGRREPFYRPASGLSSIYQDPSLAHKTVQKLITFDAKPNIMVCIAHDPAVGETLPTMNDDAANEINGWREKGLKEACHWGFLNQLPRGGQPGRTNLVENYLCEGTLYEGVEALKASGASI